MAIEPKVIDNQQLHLLSCLARAYGYHLRLMMTTKLYEVALWRKPRSVGLSEELLAGGQGYSIDEAIENCFLDCKFQQKLLGTDTCPWIEFNSPEELDVTLTLMGHHPTYEPVHMRAIDFNKWEVGPEDGAPIVLVAPPDPSKKKTESANSHLDQMSANALAAAMGCLPKCLEDLFPGAEIVGVAPGQSMEIRI